MPLRKLFCFVFLLLVLLFLPQQAFAVRYGDGRYGTGSYGNGTVDTIINTVTSFFSTSTTNTPSCGATPPTSTPHLFQIDRLGNTATIFFTPAGNPVSYYYIAYGYTPGDEQFGGQFSSSGGGAIHYTVSGLTPKTGYWFKVRAGNGCAPGGWSNSVLAGPTNGSKKVKTSFYPNAQNYVNMVSGYVQKGVNSVGSTAKKTATVVQDFFTPQPSLKTKPSQGSPKQNTPKPAASEPAAKPNTNSGNWFTNLLKSLFPF